MLIPPVRQRPFGQHLEMSMVRAPANPGHGDRWVCRAETSHEPFPGPARGQRDPAGRRSELQWEPGEFAAAAGLAVRRGWKVGVHAWGDHAVEATPDASEAILHDQPGTPTGHPGPGACRPGPPRSAGPRHRAGHSGHRPASPAVRARPGPGEVLGAGAGHGHLPLREWLDEGAAQSAGSDFPNGKYDPMASIWG